MQSSGQKLQRIALIGFGEAGGILGGDLAAQDIGVSTYDILVESEDTRATLKEKANKARVELCVSLSDAIKGADIVISAVTAAAACDVANACAPFIERRQWFLDINSIAPDTKRVNAAVIEGAGGRYVDVAVMAPVLPQRLKVPMFVGGPHASEIAPLLQTLGFNVKAVSDQVGVASLPDYLISRIAEHGRRRAAEMREVVVTAKDAGIEPTMSSATARCHDALVDEMQAMGNTYDTTKKFSWRELADRSANRAKRTLTLWSVRQVH